VRRKRASGGREQREAPKKLARGKRGTARGTVRGTGAGRVREYRASLPFRSPALHCLACSVVKWLSMSNSRKMHVVDERETHKRARREGKQQTNGCEAGGARQARRWTVRKREQRGELACVPRRNKLQPPSEWRVIYLLSVHRRAQRARCVDGRPPPLMRHERVCGAAPASRLTRAWCDRASGWRRWRGGCCRSLRSRTRRTRRT
jgi:hypothetical protein